MADLKNALEKLKGAEQIVDDVSKRYLEFENFQRLQCACGYIRDAISILKTQGPRVMTLEEVRRCGYHVFIELKDKNGAETIGSTDPEDLKEFKSLYSAFWHLHWRSGNVMLEEFYLGIPSNRDYKETDKYNATWRCWDKLPPDQLMEATPWPS